MIPRLQMNRALTFGQGMQAVVFHDESAADINTGPIIGLAKERVLAFRRNAEQLREAEAKIRVAPAGIDREAVNKAGAARLERVEFRGILVEAGFKIFVAEASDFLPRGGRIVHARRLLPLKVRGYRQCFSIREVERRHPARGACPQGIH